MYYVICDSDSPDGTARGPRVFATSRVFDTRPDAERYARTVNASRYPSAHAYDSAEVLALQCDELRAALVWALPLARDAALTHPAARNPDALRAILAQIREAEAALVHARREH